MLLRMSFSGGILIIMIAAVRFLSANRLPKKYFMMLWSVALLRLLVPVELPFRFGITVPVENAVADKMERMILSGDSLQKMTAVQTAAPEGADLSGILMRALPYVWAAAALLLSGILAVLYIRECRRMNEAIPLSGEQACSLRKEADIPERVRLLASDRIVTPVVFGIVRPKIILPSFLLSEKSGRLKFVLAHEAAHVRRGDNLWKVIMLLAVCIHWFNPLVWLMYVLFSRDMELSCDDLLLSACGCSCIPGFSGRSSNPDQKISQKETASGHRLHWYRPGNRRLSGSACGTISSKSFFSLLCIRQSLTACPRSESGTDHSQNPQSLRRSFYHCGRRMSWLQRTCRMHYAFCHASVPWAGSFQGSASHRQYFHHRHRKPYF